MTATSGLHPDATPAGGLPTRRRIAIARFGTDVAATGGIGPALAAGLDPADYLAVPGGSLPLSHRRQLTDPVTDTHTGHISLIRV